MAGTPGVNMEVGCTKLNSYGLDGMMAWAGVRIGKSIESAMNPLKVPAQDAGKQGVTHHALH